MSAERQTHPASQERVPPRDFDAEQAVLGSMLLEPGAAARALAIVGPDDFYWEDHQIIARAIEACRAQNQPVDLVTVGGELRRQNLLERVGGGTYLTALIAQVPTAAHVVRYATRVAETSYSRSCLTMLGELQELAFSDPADPLEITNEMVCRATTLANRRVSPESGLRTWADLKTEIVAMAEAAAAGRRELSAQRLGIDGLDRLLVPLDQHRLVLVKGGTGSGKSHVLVNATMATAVELAARHDGRRICVFSTEQPGMYAVRGLAWLSGVDSLEIVNGYNGERNPEQRENLRAFAEAMAEQLPISIEEGEVTEDRIEADLHRHAAQYGIAMVVLDYWQEIAVRPNRTRAEEFFRLAQRMKHLAQDVYRVPFLIASQVTFNQGSRVWQAAESQQIERAATLVMRLDRDKQRREQYTLHCEKTRLGLEFGSVPVHMDKAHSRVHLLDDHRPPEERVA